MFGRFQSSPLIALALTSLLVASGCAAMPMTRTGFLDDYPELTASPERTVAFVPDGIDLYRSDQLWAGDGYDALVIEPAVYVHSEDARRTPSNRVSDDLAAYFTRKLRKTLGEDFEIVDEPRPGAARVRAAITAIEPCNVWINTITMILLFPFDMGGISGEIEVVDSVSGDRLAAMTLYREGTPFLFLECFNRHGHARHSIKKWAKELRRVLAESPSSQE